MQLTKRASYAVIAATELARVTDGKPLPAATIASRYGLPSAFVEKILRELKIAGLVDSRKGCCGGYVLHAAPGEVSLRSVLEAVHEPLDLVRCLSPESNCEITTICPTKTAWHRINVRLRDLLDSLCLSDLIQTDA
jgi:Rrf2 family iron-sulfur cluster assembly transcriptional regulator